MKMEEDITQSSTPGNHEPNEDCSPSASDRYTRYYYDDREDRDSRSHHKKHKKSRKSSRSDMESSDESYDRRRRRKKHSRERRSRRRHRSSSKERRKGSSSPGRFSKSRSRSRPHSRSRRSKHSHRRRRYSDERSSYSEESEYERRSYKDYRRNEPSSTIMVRGLAPHLMEPDILEDIVDSGVVAKDARVIRHRETGISRGFAFIEFNSVADASTWMDTRKGLLTLQGKFTASMIYSMNNMNSSSSFNDKGSRAGGLMDWNCTNCQGHNFKRRDFCYKCRASRPEDSSSNEISSQPTCTVLLGNLDGLTVEEGVLHAFEERPGLASIPMRSVRIGRDKTTNLSLGMCYVDFNNVSDAVRLHSALKENPIEIDGKEVSVSYMKQIAQSQPILSSAAQHAVEAGKWSVEKYDTQGPYSQETIEELANYSAAHYAKTPEEHAQYLAYYRDYYSKNRYHEDSTAAPLSAISNSTVKTRNQNSQELTRPDFMVPGTDNIASMHWKSTEDGNVISGDTKLSYHDKPKHSEKYDSPEGRVHKEFNHPEKVDKLDEAKRIKKDMEKWAKSLEQKKDPAKGNMPSAPENVFSNTIIDESANKASQTKPVLPPRVSKLADDVYYTKQEQNAFVDTSKLACLLCKRQFSNPVQLEKHVKLSDLHRQNLEALKVSTGVPQTQVPSSSSIAYRDRAEERRKIFGIDKIEPRSKMHLMKKEPIKIQEPVEVGKLENNIGSKLLQKMGWEAGQGLGSRNQGRTDIIVAERRVGTLGLGMKPVVADDDGNQYANAKRLTIARYQQLE